MIATIATCCQASVSTSQYLYLQGLSDRMTKVKKKCEHLNSHKALYLGLKRISESKNNFRKRLESKSFEYSVGQPYWLIIWNFACDARVSTFEQSFQICNFFWNILPNSIILTKFHHFYTKLSFLDSTNDILTGKLVTKIDKACCHSNHPDVGLPALQCSKAPCCLQSSQNLEIVKW